MACALFRQEAINHHSAKIWGEVTLAVPFSLTLMTAFFAVSVAAILMFICVGSYARKEHVSGFLAPHLGVAAITPPRAGLIVAVHVVEGQMLAAGAPLITVSAEQTNARGGGTDSAVLAQLDQQRQSLKQQIGLDQQKYEAEKQRLMETINSLEGELQGMLEEIQIQAERSKVASDQMAAITDLARRGLVTKFELKKRQDNSLSQQQAVLVLKRSYAEKQQDLAMHRNDLVQLPLTAEKQGAQSEAAIAELDAKIEQTDGQRGYLITAPKAGRVSALQAWPGKMAEPNKPLMTIVPEGDVLKAELFVSPRAIGLVAPGQTVHLSYSSFPYQQFGFARGKVETISYTLLKPDQSTSPIILTAPAYRVTVSLNQQTINANGKVIALQPDMQLDADILFDRRSLVAWIFGPILTPWQHS